MRLVALDTYGLQKVTLKPRQKKGAAVYGPELLCVLQGLSKSGLMGFCDVALGEEKVLLVHYLFQNCSHTATIPDKVSSPATPQFLCVPCITVTQQVHNTI